MTVSNTGAGAVLALTRSKGFSKDAMRSYIVILDGKEAGTIRPGKRLELQINPGPHEVFMKINWCRSPLVEVDAKLGEVIQLRCQPGGYWFPLLAITLGRNSYISLSRV